MLNSPLRCNCRRPCFSRSLQLRASERRDCNNRCPRSLPRLRRGKHLRQEDVASGATLIQIWSDRVFQHLHSDCMVELEFWDFYVPHDTLAWQAHNNECITTDRAIHVTSSFAKPSRDLWSDLHPRIYHCAYSRPYSVQCPLPSKPATPRLDMCVSEISHASQHLQIVTWRGEQTLNILRWRWFCNDPIAAHPEQFQIQVSPMRRMRSYATLGFP
jgi:hypothetical protein